MARRKRSNDEEISFEELENEGSETEDTSFFGHLRDLDDECPECGYEGVLRSTRKGIQCPKCKAIVIPNDD